MIIKNLSYAYDDLIILDNISFNIKPGEMTGIVGESGAGKSTLLRLLGNLIPIQKGTISIKENIGIIFQDFNLFPHLNVIENLSLSLKINKAYSKTEITQQANSLLNDFKILDKATSYIDQLSGGERQRVAIARALMLKPKILLIDEATSNLDPKRRDEFMQILNDLKNQGIAIVIVSHDHDILKINCDRLLYLHQGKIVKCQTLKKEG